MESTSFIRIVDHKMKQLLMLYLFMEYKGAPSIRGDKVKARIKPSSLIVDLRIGFPLTIQIFELLVSIMNHFSVIGFPRVLLRMTISDLWKFNQPPSKRSLKNVA